MIEAHGGLIHLRDLLADTPLWSTVSHGAAETGLVGVVVPVDASDSLLGLCSNRLNH